MKLSKAQLKVLIKECLVEILNEGLGGSTLAVGTGAPTLAARTAITDASRRPAVSEGKRRPYNPNPALDEPVRPRNVPPASALAEAVKFSAGGNPIMADILADTAATTFQTIGGTLVAGGGPEPSKGPVAMEQIVGTPEEVFGSDTAGKWADLAFNTPRPGKST
jgi:hypothetical protein